MGLCVVCGCRCERVLRCVCLFIYLCMYVSCVVCMEICVLGWICCIWTYVNILYNVYIVEFCVCLCGWISVYGLYIVVYLYMRMSCMYLGVGVVECLYEGVYIVVSVVCVNIYVIVWILLSFAGVEEVGENVFKWRCMWVCMGVCIRRFCFCFRFRRRGRVCGIYVWVCMFLYIVFLWRFMWVCTW